jgi:hypothetical protein
VPGSEYVRLAKELGLKDVRTADWSEFVVSEQTVVCHMRGAVLIHIHDILCLANETRLRSGPL